MKILLAHIQNDIYSIISRYKGEKKKSVRLAINRLVESLERLGKRHNEYIEIETKLNNFLDKESHPQKLADCQLVFVDKMEAFHQHVYVTLSTLVHVLNHIGIIGIKDQHPSRSMQKFLKFLTECTIFTESFIEEVNLLLNSIKFRADFIDHPQGKAPLDWMTWGHLDDMYIIYYRISGENIQNTIISELEEMNPSSKKFKFALLPNSKYFASPNRRETNHSLQAVVRALLFQERRGETFKG